MAIIQPLATDTLDSPSHSLLHRQIAADDGATVQSLVINSSDYLVLLSGVIFSSASGVITLGGTGATNNENITLDFETTANAVTLGSGSGVDTFKFGSLSTVLNDGKRASFGTGFDSAFAWATEGNDNLQLGLNLGNADYSGFFCLVEKGDLNNANRSPLSVATDPTFRVYSADAGEALDYVEMYHNQDNAIIDWGNGDLYLEGGMVYNDALNGFAALRSGAITWKDADEIYLPGNVVYVKNKVAFWDSQLTKDVGSPSASTWY